MSSSNPSALTWEKSEPFRLGSAHHRYLMLPSSHLCVAECAGMAAVKVSHVVGDSWTGRQIRVLPAPLLSVCGVGKLLALSSPHLMWTQLRVETEWWLIPSTQSAIPSWVAPPLSLSAFLLPPLTFPSPHLSYLILWVIAGTHGI